MRMTDEALPRTALMWIRQDERNNGRTQRDMDTYRRENAGKQMIDVGDSKKKNPT